MKKLLEIKNLSAGYGNKSIVKDINLTLEKGKNLGIIGESGSGKTTIALAIANLCKVFKGDILLKGKSILKLNKADIKEQRKSIQLVLQDSKTGFDPRTNIRDYIREPLSRLTDLSLKEINNKSIELLEQVGLSENYLNRRPHELSGGERQRISLTRALSIAPDIIICDEITSALDVTIQKQIIDLLLELQEKMKISFIFVSHDLPLVSNICDQFLIVKDGAALEDVNVENLLECENDYVRELISSAFTI